MDAYKNFAYSTVATAPSPAMSGTSLVVAAGTGAAFPATPFNAVVWPAGVQPTNANAEIVRVTARSTDTLTIARTQEGTSARSILVGDQIAAAWTAKLATDITANAAALAHNEITADVTIAATTEAGATTVVTASAVTFDGATDAIIEFFSPQVITSTTASSAVVIVIYDGASSIGFLTVIQNPGGQASVSVPVLARRRLTPSAAAHTYSIRVYSSAGTNGTVKAGAGGAAAYMASYIRITKA